MNKRRTAMTTNRQNFFWLLLLVFWVSFLRLPTFTQVVTVWDESLYFMIAHDWLNKGILPYTGLFDHKPLGIYAIFAASIALFGDAISSIRIISIIAVTLSSIGIYQVCKQLEFQRTGVIAAFIFPIMALGMDGVTSNTELFVTPFTVWAMASLCFALQKENSHTRLWISASGLLFGFALATKYVVILEAVFGGAILILTSRLYGWTYRKILILSILMASFAGLPTLLSGLYYQLNGKFSVFFEHNFAANSRHISQTEWVTFWSSLIGTTKFWVKWVLPAITIGGLGFFFHRKNLKQVMVGVFLSLWITFTVMQAWIIGKFYDHHYYLALAPVCVLFAWAVNGINLKTLNIAITSLLVGCIYWGGQTIQRYYHPWIQDYLAHESPYKEAAAYLRQYLKSDETIYVVNDQLILYYLAEVDPPTDYAYFHFIMDPHFSAVARVNPLQEIDRIFSKHPAFVIASEQPGHLPSNPLISYALNKLNGNYSLATSVNHLKIYRRNLSNKTDIPKQSFSSIDSNQKYFTPITYTNKNTYYHE